MGGFGNLADQWVGLLKWVMPRDAGTWEKGPELRAFASQGRCSAWWASETRCLGLLLYGCHSCSMEGIHCVCPSDLKKIIFLFFSLKSHHKPISRDRFKKDEILPFFLSVPSFSFLLSSFLLASPYQPYLSHLAPSSTEFRTAASALIA